MIPSDSIGVMQKKKTLYIYLGDCISENNDIYIYIVIH